MKLIIGGAFQGKKEYAKNAFPEAAKNLIDGITCSEEEIYSCGMIVHFHEYIKRFMADEEKMRALPKALIEKNPKIVIVSNELGYGVVPIDKFDRAYRELTGRVCCDLAAVSDEVIRVVCGLGSKLK